VILESYLAEVELFDLPFYRQIQILLHRAVLTSLDSLSLGEGVSTSSRYVTHRDFYQGIYKLMH
jgi:hypothetical protein